MARGEQLWQIEAVAANRNTSSQACKEAGKVEQTYFPWRKG
jgi:hypothetical protein